MKKYLMLLALAALLMSGCSTKKPNVDDIKRQTCINLGIETGMSQQEAEQNCIDLEKRVLD